MHNALTHRTSFRTLFLTSILMLFFFCGNTLAFAQTPGLSLVTDPRIPTPYTTVTVSLDDYGLNTIGSYVSWFVDGTEQIDARNSRTLQIKTGGPGEKSIVRAILSQPNSPTISTSLTLIPSQIDIILEADTYTPHFYHGRALPSRNSPMRVVALVNDGSRTPSNTLTYKWSMDGSALFGGTLKGKNILDIQMPHYNDSILSVEIFTEDGSKIGEGDVLLTHTEPELHFYEHNPLRGLSERELVSPFRLLSEETTLYGEPFFIDAHPTGKDATYTWSLNNETIIQDTPVPNALTLQHVGGGSESTIDLRVITKKTIPQLVTKAFHVIFE